MNRSKTLEVIARAIAADEDTPFRNHADLYRLSARAILAALESSGLAVVPVEATIEMEDAGQEIIGPCYVNEKMADPARIWCAMLSASPYGKAGKEEASAKRSGANSNPPQEKDPSHG